MRARPAGLSSAEARGRRWRRGRKERAARARRQRARSRGSRVRAPGRWPSGSRVPAGPKRSRPEGRSAEAQWLCTTGSAGGRTARLRHGGPGWWRSRCARGSARRLPPAQEHMSRASRHRYSRAAVRRRASPSSSSMQSASSLDPRGRLFGSSSPRETQHRPAPRRVKLPGAVLTKTPHRGGVLFMGLTCSRPALSSRGCRKSRRVSGSSSSLSSALTSYAAAPGTSPSRTGARRPARPCAGWPLLTPPTRPLPGARSRSQGTRPRIGRGRLPNVEDHPGASVSRLGPGLNATGGSPPRVAAA